MIRGRQDGTTGIRRNRHFVKTFGSLVEVRKRVDGLSCRAHPIVNSRVERIEAVSNDVVHKAGHRGLDETLRKVGNAQGHVRGREREVHAANLVNREAHLAFNGVLQVHRCSFAHGEISRAADRNRAALLVTVHLVAVFFFRRTIEGIENAELVFKHNQRLFGDDVRSQGRISHNWPPSEGKPRLTTGRVCYFKRPSFRAAAYCSIVILDGSRVPTVLEVGTFAAGCATARVGVCRCFIRAS